MTITKKKKHHFLLLKLPAQNAVIEMMQTTKISGLLAKALIMSPGNPEVLDYTEIMEARIHLTKGY